MKGACESWQGLAPEKIRFTTKVAKVKLAAGHSVQWYGEGEDREANRDEGAAGL